MIVDHYIDRHHANHIVQQPLRQSNFKTLNIWREELHLALRLLRLCQICPVICTVNLTEEVGNHVLPSAMTAVGTHMSSQHIPYLSTREICAFAINEVICRKIAFTSALDAIGSCFFFPCHHIYSRYIPDMSVRVNIHMEERQYCRIEEYEQLVICIFVQFNRNGYQRRLRTGR